mmetsp:Transcript_7891/g.1034  ORF Transcript_7891/g.1034 Transcript_7891/m.1034 type:complete len:326 (+) Transcript_7891:2950-3927(+)
MAITDYFVVESLTYGTSIAVLIVILCLVCLPLNEYVSTSNPLDVASWCALIFGVLLNFAYGVIYYLAELDEDTDDDNDALNIIILTFFFPILVPTVLGIVKWRDNNWKVDKVVYASLIISTIFTILFCLTVMAIIDFIIGLALLVADAILLLYIGIAVVYVKNDFFLPRGCRYFAFLLTGLLCLTAFVIGLIIEDLSAFAGFTITYFTAVAFISIYTVSIWIRSIKYRDTAPIFFSPWIFPIYKYSPMQERIAEYNRAGIFIYLVIFMLNFWSILAIIWVDPIDIGVSVGSLSLILLILISIYISGISPLQLSEAVRFVSDEDNQ